MSFYYPPASGYPYTSPFGGYSSALSTYPAPVGTIYSVPRAVPTYSVPRTVAPMSTISPYVYPSTYATSYATPLIPKPKLVYFNGRGRAEIIRLLFALAGLEYEDVRFKPNADNATNPSRMNDDFAEFKKTGKSITGQVPYLEIDGLQLVQSIAIARYLARKYGYYGHGDPEQLQIDMILDTVEDLRVKVISAMFEKDESRKPALLKEVGETFIPKYGEALEKFLDANQYKSGYFVGVSLTLADLFVYDFWSTVIKNNPDAAKPFKKLAALVEKVGAIPPIAAWIAKRPDTPF